MLVLSRKQGQLVELAEVGVVVHVVSVRGSRVQLGFEAPPEITINRVENRHAPSDGDPVAKEDQSHRSDRDTRQDTHGDFTAAEARRIRDELTRMETEFAALAVLSSTKDQRHASRIAGESIQRLQGIKRSLGIIAARQRREAKPISELVKVRSDVLQQLRNRQPTETDQEAESISWPIRNKPSTHLREAATRYDNEASELVPACGRGV